MPASVTDNHASAITIPFFDPRTGDFLDALRAHNRLPLVFRYGGREILPGYHVTEVKGGQFASLDCGANPETWSETFIQLWDVPGESISPMPVSKFLAIMDKVTRERVLDPASRLTFEVSNGVGPLELHAVEKLTIADGRLLVSLKARAASCKPRDRWLSAREAEAASIAPAPVGAEEAGCCSQPGAVAQTSACCG